MKTGKLVAYFVKQSDARTALKKLQRNGDYRAAWISKDANGKIETEDPFLRRLLKASAAAFILFGALGALISIGLGPTPLSNGTFYSHMVAAIACGCAGVVLCAGPLFFVPIHITH